MGLGVRAYGVCVLQAEAALSLVESRTLELFELQEELRDWLVANKEKMHEVEVEVEGMQQVNDKP